MVVDFAKIKAVAECHDKYNANEYIKRGWKLIKVSSPEGHQHTYVFGWFNEGEPELFDEISATYERMGEIIDRMQKNGMYQDPMKANQEA